MCSRASVYKLQVCMYVTVWATPSLPTPDSSQLCVSGEKTSCSLKSDDNNSKAVGMSEKLKYPASFRISYLWILAYSLEFYIQFPEIHSSWDSPYPDIWFFLFLPNLSINCLIGWGSLIQCAWTRDISDFSFLSSGIFAYCQLGTTNSQTIQNPKLFVIGDTQLPTMVPEP